MEKVSGRMIKADFVKHLQKEYKEILGADISLDKAYELFKMSILLPYQLAVKKNIKILLAGIGVFRLYKTKKGNITTKYYTSETVVRCLTKGYDLRDYVHNPQKYRNPDGIVEDTKKTTPKKEADKKEAEVKPVKKAAVKKEAKVEEKAPVKKASAIKQTPAPKSTSIPKKAIVEAELQAEVEEDLSDFDIEDDFSDFEL